MPKNATKEDVEKLYAEFLLAVEVAAQKLSKNRENRALVVRQRVDMDAIGG